MEVYHPTGNCTGTGYHIIKGFHKADKNVHIHQACLIEKGWLTSSDYHSQVRSAAFAGPAAMPRAANNATMAVKEKLPLIVLSFALLRVVSADPQATHGEPRGGGCCVRSFREEASLGAG